MFWLGLAVGLVAFLVILAFIWRHWIAPWRDVETLVREIRDGRQPATFLVGGAEAPRRIGLALEDLFKTNQRLAQELAERAAGSETILGAMQDGLLVVDTDRRITLLNRTF